MFERRTSMLIVFLALGTLSTIGLFWGTNVPLGVPGEWVWKRISVPDDSRLAAILGATTTAVVGVAYCLVAWLGARRIEAAASVETAVWLVVLAAAGFAWLWAVQESPAPVENRLAKSPWVTYYPGPDGYFEEARYQMSDVASYLAGYEKRMTEGDVLHFGTHPPGLALFHGGLITLCNRSPAITRFLISTQPSSAVEAFDTIEQSERSGPRPLLPQDRAAIWLAILAIQTGGVATLLPLFYLARRTASQEAAWMAAVLWPLVPSLAVFLPKSDALIPLLGTTFLALWLTGLNRRSPLLCFSSGLVLWLGMFLSLAVLPVGLLAAILTVAELRFELRSAVSPVSSREIVLRAIKFVGWSLLGFALPVVLLWLVWDANLIRIWSWNYRNHAGFYDRYQRTYWAWFLVNPLELLFGVGLPVMLLAGLSCLKILNLKRWDASAISAVGCFTVWAILWISGKNMGEAARLWLVVMPWPIWIAAAWFDASPIGHASARRSAILAAPDARLIPLTWIVVIAAQMVACAATVSRVNGFDFGL